MNLIEQLGGYERAKAFLNAASYTMDELIMMQRSGVRPQHVEKALLEYRRQHNIFEVEDKVVYVDDFMTDSVSVVSEVNDRVWLNDNKAVCIKEIIKHATDEEIKAGKRLDVKSEN